MKRKTMISILGTLSLLGGLVSCGSSVTPLSNASAAASGSAAQQTSQPSSSDAVSIEFWIPSGQAIQKALNQAIDDFEVLVKENDGVDLDIKLVYQGAYSDLLTKITKGFAANYYPSLAIAYPDHVAEYLAAEGDNPGKFVVDLSSYINDEKIGFGKESWIGDGEASDFIPAYYEEGSCYAREGIYSLPVMKSSECMFYNLDVVSYYANKYKPELALTSATKVQEYMNHLTWDEFMGLAKYINDNATTKREDFLCPVYYDSDSNLFISKCVQNNIPFVSLDEQGNGQILFNNDQAKDMVRKLKADYDDGLIATKNSNASLYGSDLFKNEQIYFDIGSTGGAGYQAPVGDTFTVGVCPVPYDNDNPLYVSQGLTATVLKTADDTDGRKALYSYKFLKYITSAEVNADLCINGSEGYSPVRQSAYETDLFKEYLENEDNDFQPKVAQIVKDVINGHYYNTACFKGTASIRSYVGGIIGNVFLGKEDIDKAFTSAETSSRMDM